MHCRPPKKAASASCKENTARGTIRPDRRSLFLMPCGTAVLRRWSIMFVSQTAGMGQTTAQRLLVLCRAGPTTHRGSRTISPTVSGNKANPSRSGQYGGRHSKVKQPQNATHVSSASQAPIVWASHPTGSCSVPQATFTRLGQLLTSGPEILRSCGNEISWHLTYSASVTCYCIQDITTPHRDTCERRPGREGSMNGHAWQRINMPTSTYSHRHYAGDPCQVDHGLFR